MFNFGEKLVELHGNEGKVFNNYASRLSDGIVIWSLAGIEYDETFDPQQEISRTYQVIHYAYDESERDDLMKKFYEVGTVTFGSEGVNVDANDTPTGDIYRTYTVKIDIV